MVQKSCSSDDPCDVRIQRRAVKSLGLVLVSVFPRELCALSLIAWLRAGEKMEWVSLGEEVEGQVQLIYSTINKYDIWVHKNMHEKHGVFRSLPLFHACCHHQAPNTVSLER